ncbi:hypothetical protein EfmAA96_04920 [Enterococcus faecium]|nr:hypothetical protein EfmAA96_04920 [Enterococcus faecium]
MLLASYALPLSELIVRIKHECVNAHLCFIFLFRGKQVRYISGYRNVINKALELNRLGKDTQLAIETSGHAAFKENYFLDDGAYVIAKILMLLPELIVVKEDKYF